MTHLDICVATRQNESHVALGQYNIMGIKSQICPSPTLGETV